MFLQILFTLSFLLSSSNALDFCVGDLNATRSPTGYSCKKVEVVTVNDFVLSDFRVAGNTSNLFKISQTPGFSSRFPGVNGLGISVARHDFAVGGVAPMHTHPDATELIVVIQGTVCAGFISSTNKVYMKTIEEGDVFAFPQGLMHFQINVGKTQALSFASYSSDNPSIYFMDNAWFANDLPTNILHKTTFFDHDQIKKLKGFFGGSG